MSKNEKKDKKVLTFYQKNYDLRKYNLLKIINSFSIDESALLKTTLRKELKVSRVTFNNWLNIHIEDTAEIPSIKLAIMAKTLGVTIESCINIPIEAIKIKLPSLNTESGLH